MSIVLDLRGLKCPLPVLRTRKALARLAPGAELVVETTDPLARLDLEHLAFETGDDYFGVETDGSVTRHRIRKRR